MRHFSIPCKRSKTIAPIFAACILSTFFCEFKGCVIFGCAPHPQTNRTIAKEYPMTNNITVEQVRELFRYDPLTGDLFWRVRPANRMQAGDKAGTLSKASGYMKIKIKSASHQSHRLIWLFVYGSFPDFEIDHINGIRDDNRLINLRAVSRSENCRNRGMQSNNTSGVMGVSWCKRANQWLARIYVDGANKHLGYFDRLQDAADARKTEAHAQAYHANHGDPNRVY